MDPETAQIVVLTFLGGNWPWYSNFMNILVLWHAKPCTHLLKGILPACLLVCQILTGINFKFHPIRERKMILLHSCPFYKKSSGTLGSEALHPTSLLYRFLWALDQWMSFVLVFLSPHGCYFYQFLWKSSWQFWSLFLKKKKNSLPLRVMETYITVSQHSVLVTSKIMYWYKCRSFFLWSESL